MGTLKRALCEQWGVTQQMQKRGSAVPSKSLLQTARNVFSFLPLFFLPLNGCTQQQGAPKPVPNVAVQGAVATPQTATPQVSASTPCPPLGVHAGDIISALTFSPDGQWLATAAQDSWLKPTENPTHVAVWNALTGSLVRKWDTKYPVIQAVFSPDGEHLATVDQKGTVQVVDYRSGQEIYTARGSHLAYAPDGKIWAAGVYRVLPKSKSQSGQGNSTIEIHEAVTGKILRTIDADPWVTTISLVITQQGLVLGAGCTEDEDCQGSVQGWELASGKLVKSYPIEGRVFSPDGRWAANIDPASSKLKLFDLSNGELKANIPLRDNATQSVAVFSADGHTLALAQYSQEQPGSYGIVIDLWSASTGSKIATLQRPSGADNQGGRVIPNTSPSGLRAVAFSPDGKRVAAANYFITMAKTINCAFSHPDITTWYSLLKIWDATTGRELITLGAQ
jgi:WD40 repeat protein